jgi:hypothetical protein
MAQFSFLAAGNSGLAVAGTVSGYGEVSQREIKVHASHVALCHLDNNPFKGPRELLSIRAQLTQEHPTLKGRTKTIASSNEISLNRTTRPGDTTEWTEFDFYIPSPDYYVNLDTCWLTFEIKIRTDGKEGFSYLGSSRTMFMRGIATPPGAEKSPATVFPVTTIPVNSELAIAGSVDGRCEVSREGLRVHAIQVLITHRDNNPFQGERQILSMSVALARADAGGRGTWKILLRGPEVSINRTTRPNENFVLKDMDFVIPNPDAKVDLDDCWLIFQVRLITECAEGFSYIHTPHTVFAPGQKPITQK